MDQLLQSCKDGKAAAVRDIAEEHIEYRNLVLHSVEEISVGHGKLIVVGQHRQIAFLCPVDLHNCHTFLLNDSALFPDTRRKAIPSRS